MPVIWKIVWLISFKFLLYLIQKSMLLKISRHCYIRISIFEFVTIFCQYKYVKSRTMGHMCIVNFFVDSSPLILWLTVSIKWSTTGNIKCESNFWVFLSFPIVLYFVQKIVENRRFEVGHPVVRFVCTTVKGNNCSLSKKEGH